MNSTQAAGRSTQDAQDAGTSHWFCYLPACLAAARQQQLLPIVRCCLGLRRKCYSPLPSLSISFPIPGHVYYPPSSASSVVVCSGSVNVKFDSHLGMHVLYWGKGEGAVHRFAAPTCIGACFRFRFSLPPLTLTHILSTLFVSFCVLCVHSR